MKRIVWMGLSALGLLVSGTAGAQNNCDRARNDFDSLYCLMKVYNEADKDLNVSYQKLVGRLNTTQRATLRQAQLTWIRRRNEQCSANDEKGFVIYMDCATKMTIDRTNFLNDRYRECVSSGCRTSLLSTVGRLLGRHDG